MNSNRVIVEKIINGGFGLARETSGQVVLLRNCLPGEEVDYVPVEKRKNTLFGIPKTIVKLHINRVDPPCQYYGTCGGCTLQHASYEEQLTIKNSIITELFQHNSSLFNHPVPSPCEFGYRQRIRLQVRDGQLGFSQFRSHQIVPVKQCLLAQPAINATLTATKKHHDFKKLCSITKEIEYLFNPLSEKVTLLFYLDRKPRPSDKKSAEVITDDIELVERIFFKGDTFSQQGPYCRAETLSINNLLTQQFDIQDYNFSFQLSWEVGGFCQVNLLQNHNLISYVLKQCQPTADKNILDLFCGMGNFSVPLALSAKSLTGAEGQGAAIRCAKRNSISASLENTQFIKGNIAEVCSSIMAGNRLFDITVIDPPRQGVPDLTATIAKITGEKIIYVSCDPATLARDIRQFEKHCFTVKGIQPFDMFPQTHHIETVAVLEKN